jgi:hypothetical protein
LRGHKLGCSGMRGKDPCSDLCLGGNPISGDEEGPALVAGSLIASITAPLLGS